MWIQIVHFNLVYSVWFTALWCIARAARHGPGPFYTRSVIEHPEPYIYTCWFTNMDMVSLEHKNLLQQAVSRDGVQEEDHPCESSCSLLHNEFKAVVGTILPPLFGHVGAAQPLSEG